MNEAHAFLYKKLAESHPTPGYNPQVVLHDLHRAVTSDAEVPGVFACGPLGVHRQATHMQTGIFVHAVWDGDRMRVSAGVLWAQEAGQHPSLPGTSATRFF